MRTKFFLNEVQQRTENFALMAEPEIPKIDFKMMIVPIMLLLGRQIDFKNLEIVNYARICFFTGVVLFNKQIDN